MVGTAQERLCPPYGAIPCPIPLLPAMECPTIRPAKSANVQGSKKHALSPHHAARSQSRRRAEILPGRARPEGGPPHRQREGKIHAGVPVRRAGHAPAGETAEDARGAAGGAHL